MKFFKNIKGLALTETLAATAILGLGLIVVAYIFQDGYAINRLSRNYLIGEALATESIETVKNIRNSNRLLRPNFINCWLTKDPYNDVCDDNASPQNQVDTTIYYSPMLSGGKWILANNGVTDLELEDGDDPDFALYLDGGIYSTDSGGGANEQSNFYRRVKFLERDNEKAAFEVKVQWMESSRVRTIIRNHILYNHN